MIFIKYVLIVIFLMSYNISALDLPDPLKIDPVNKQIDILFQNPDSLIKLLQIVYPNKKSNDKDIKDFKDYISKFFVNSYFVAYDQWEKELKIDSTQNITEYYYVAIESTENKEFVLQLYFMKKNGKWQFIDFPFKKDPFFKKNKDSRY